MEKVGTKASFTGWRISPSTSCGYLTILATEASVSTTNRVPASPSNTELTQMPVSKTTSARFQAMEKPVKPIIMANQEMGKFFRRGLVSGMLCSSRKAPHGGDNLY